MGLLGDSGSGDWETNWTSTQGQEPLPGEGNALICLLIYLFRFGYT